MIHNKAVLLQVFVQAVKNKATRLLGLFLVHRFTFH